MTTEKYNRIETALDDNGVVELSARDARDYLYDLRQTLEHLHLIEDEASDELGDMIDVLIDLARSVDPITVELQRTEMTPSGLMFCVK